MDAVRVLWLLPIGVLAAIILYPIGTLVGLIVASGPHSLAVLTSPHTVRLLGNTMVYTVVSTAWALVVGLPLAWILSRSDSRSMAAARALVAVGFVLPEFIYAIAYVFLLDGSTGYVTRLLRSVLPHAALPLYGVWGMSLITGFFAVPQIVVLVEPALRNLSAELEEAAEICGASVASMLRRITLPLVAPAVLTATLLTFLLAFASFGIPAALGIPVNFYVLSTEVYSVVITYPPQFDRAAVYSLLFLAIGLVIAAGQIYATRMSLRYRTVGGKGFRVVHAPAPPLVRALLAAYVWIVTAIVAVLPLIVVAAVSLAVKWWQIPGPLTLQHYVAVLARDPLVPTMATTTALVTVLSVAGTLAFALALGIFGLGERGALSGATRLLGFVALSVPPIAFTIGSLLAYVHPPVALYGTIWILVFTYWARFYPLAANPIADGLTQLEPALAESALVAGASAWRTFWRVQFPLVRPVAIAAGLVVMMYTMRELLSAVFLQSSQVKMAMVAIFNYWDEGSLEHAAALSTVIVLISVTVFFIANRFQTGAGWRR